MNHYIQVFLAITSLYIYSDPFHNGTTLARRHLRDKFRKINISLENKKLPDWMKANIHREFQDFQSFSTEDLERTYDQHPDRLIHFRIRDGIVYYRCNRGDTEHPVPDYVVVMVKLMAQPNVHIENGDFLLYTWDSPDKLKSPYPILCLSKHRESNYVMIPDWFSLLTDRPSVMDKIDEGCRAFPWESKINMGFWIGAPNGELLDNNELWKTSPRPALIYFSLLHPDLLWARFCPYTNESRFCNEMIAARPLISSDRIELFDACRYKYQIDVDGWSCGFHRCQWALRSNCVPVKQKSPNIQWYYAGLEPYVHYIPYETDCSDLKEAIEWLQTHDEQAKQIALNGRSFHQEYLNTDMIYLYLYEVLLRYNQLNLSHQQ
jgi:hypothetical protein